MGIAKRLKLKKLNGEEEEYKVGINGVESISVFDNSIRIDFKNNACPKIIFSKDLREFEWDPDRPGIKLTPLKFK